MTLTPPQGAQSADPVREAALNYMAAFGQGLEAHGIPMGPQQKEADAALRAALAAPEGPAGDMTVNELRAKLQDPVAVHVALVRGEIAKPPIRDMLHAYGAEALARWDAAPEAPPPVEARQPEPEGQKLARMWLATHYTDEYDARDIEALCWKILGHDTAPDDLEAVAIIEGQPRAAHLADWQKRAIDIGFKYWRASDAHGVTGTPEQATTLLADLLGVEVEIAALAAPAGAIQPQKCQICKGVIENCTGDDCDGTGEFQAHLVGAPVTLSDAASEKEKQA